MTRPLRVLLCHPGAQWSTADVEAGLRYGLQQLGVTVIPFRLDLRIDAAQLWLKTLYRRKVKDDPTTPRPGPPDVVEFASEGAVTMALRYEVDAVLVVSGMLLHPNTLVLLNRARLPVALLLTESPYDHLQELKLAALCDGCWTHERTVLADFQKVTRAGYLPHGWHPERHTPAAAALNAAAVDVASHDVVFVGSGFPERVSWFNAIDWTGIDLGLYGVWKGLGLSRQVARAVRGGTVDNVAAAALYAKAKIGLNLYRTFGGVGRRVTGESLSPRAYELAACGVFHVSDYRAEVAERFGHLVPTFKTPTEAATLIRRWLPDDAGRARIAAQLPDAVAGCSWTDRARVVLGDLQRLLADNVRAA